MRTDANRCVCLPFYYNRGEGRSSVTVTFWEERGLWMAKLSYIHKYTWRVTISGICMTNCTFSWILVINNTAQLSFRGTHPKTTPNSQFRKFIISSYIECPLKCQFPWGKRVDPLSAVGSAIANAIFGYRGISNKNRPENKKSQNIFTWICRQWLEAVHWNTGY